MTTAITFIGKPVTGLYSAAQVRASDHFAIHELGISSFTLMTKAAEHALQAALTRWADSQSLRCYCGGGNNGGDGFVLAALAKKRGLKVEVVLMAPSDTLRNDAQKAYLLALSAGVRFIQPAGMHDLAAVDITVDALLGTGQNRAPTDLLAAAIASMNSTGSKVLALDIPTGIDADSGKLLGDIAVKAGLTVSFIAAKQGLVGAVAKPWVGELVVTDLDLPEKAYQQQADIHLFDEAQRYALLPPRAVDSHKGDHGRCLIVGGNKGYFGAALLAARAALRSGVGLLSLLSHADHASLYSQAQPEIMSRGYRVGDALTEWLTQFDVIAIGPGLGQDEWAVSVLDQVVAANKPMVVDADALNLVAQQRVNWVEGQSRVFTPHPGEAARLLQCATADIQANRVEAAQRIAEQFHATVVLKGQGSLVLDAGGQGHFITTGNAGLATGGSGDVLTGVIAAMMAQGFAHSAALGTYIHGLAADMAAALGQRGMLPSDVIPQLRNAVNP